MTVRLTGVFAHPDDDVYALGGTLLRHRGEVELALVFATSGEAGPITDPSLASRATLGAVREREQRACLHALGYADARVTFLRHPDYYLPDVPRERLAHEIEDVLRAERPHVVVTFGPDGMTSHHDHVRVGEAATAAFHAARGAAPGDDGVFARLYYAALARSDVDRFYAGVRNGGFDYGEEGRLFDVTGVADDDVAVRVDTTPVRAPKLGAILEHRTQLVEHERVPEPLRWIHLDSECFVRAWPPRASGDAPRAGLLDDLAPARG
ncbi:MAG TPA: PIG-L family deacetylase [Actinomycetota bacterium]|nr:PIG-L family deacetylase [Actinomycetota bacterium]